MPFQIVRNDITKMKTDAIVNPVNPDAVIGAGTETAIYEAAGKDKLMKLRTKLGHIPAGEAGITASGNLSAKYIIHASGPVYIDGEHGEANTLKSCYEKSLKLAISKRCKSIAFPLLATGSYGFPREEAIKIAFGVFGDFLLKEEMDIYLVVFDKTSTRISGKLFADVAAYVDENYVEDTLIEEYATEYNDRYQEQPRRGRDRYRDRKTTRLVARSKMKSAEAMPYVDETPISFGAPSMPQMPKMAREEEVHFEELISSKNLDEILNSTPDSFAEYLQNLINKKGMTNAEVYNKANLTKQYFSKLINGKINPTKEKILCIAIALRLNMDETIDFLRYAGYTFSPCSKVDLVFEHFITHQNYDIYSIDIVLFDYGLPSLMD